MKGTETTRLRSNDEAAGTAGLPGAALVGGRRGSTSGMQNDSKKSGLCSTCFHCGSCALCANHSMPIHYCEEFTTQEVGRMGASQKDLRRVGQSSGGTTSASGCGKHMGLCMNCVHKDTCTFPRPEGGVWRCNEYE